MNVIPFSCNPLNRASEKRIDANWIAAKQRDPSSVVLPMWRLEPLLLGPEKADPPVPLGLLRPGVADSLASAEAPCIFLGLDGDQAIFALDISAAKEPDKTGPLA